MVFLVFELFLRMCSIFFLVFEGVLCFYSRVF